MKGNIVSNHTNTIGTKGKVSLFLVNSSPHSKGERNLFSTIVGTSQAHVEGNVPLETKNIGALVRTFR